jgi:hypothetical protein
MLNALKAGTVVCIWRSPHGTWHITAKSSHEQT